MVTGGAALLVILMTLRYVLATAPEAGFVAVDDAMRQLLQEQRTPEAFSDKEIAGTATKPAMSEGGMKGQKGSSAVPPVPGNGGIAAEQGAGDGAAAGAPGELGAQAGAAASQPGPGSQPQPVSPQASDGRLDLNRATAEQLDALPGIGPSRAQAIIELRKKLGGFRSAAQLKEVKGIGEQTFKKLEPLVTILP